MRFNIYLVPLRRLELLHLSIPEPKSGASTNSAKGAINLTILIYHRCNSVIFIFLTNTAVAPEYAIVYTYLQNL